MAGDREHQIRVSQPQVFEYRSGFDQSRQITFLKSPKANLWKTATEQATCFFSISEFEKGSLGSKNLIRLISWDSTEDKFVYQVRDDKGEVSTHSAPRKALPHTFKPLPRSGDRPGFSSYQPRQVDKYQKPEDLRGRLAEIAKLKDERAKMATYATTWRIEQNEKEQRALEKECERGETREGLKDLVDDTRKKYTKPIDKKALPSKEDLRIRDVVAKMQAKAKGQVSPHTPSLVIHKTNKVALKTFEKSHFSLKVKGCLESILHFLATPFVALYTMLFHAAENKLMHDTVRSLGPVDHERRGQTNHRTFLAQVNFLSSVFAKADSHVHSYNEAITTVNREDSDNLEVEQESWTNHYSVPPKGSDTQNMKVFKSGAQKLRDILSTAFGIGTLMWESKGKGREAIKEAASQIALKVNNLATDSADTALLHKIDNRVVIPFGMGEGKDYVPHFLVFEMTKTGNADDDVQVILKHIHIAPPTVTKGKVRTSRSYDFTEAFKQNEVEILIRRLINMLPKDGLDQSNDKNKSGPTFDDNTLDNLLLDYGYPIEEAAPRLETTSRDPVKALYALVRELGIEESDRINSQSSQLETITRSKSSFLLHYINGFIDFVKANETKLDTNELYGLLQGLKYHTEKLKHRLEKEEGIETANAVTAPLLDYIDDKLVLFDESKAKEKQDIANLNQPVTLFSAKMAGKFSESLKVEAPKQKEVDSRVLPKYLKLVESLKANFAKNANSEAERKKVIDSVFQIIDEVEALLKANDCKAAKVLILSLLKAMPTSLSKDGQTKTFWDSLKTKEEITSFQKALFQLSEKLFEAALRLGTFPLPPEEAFEFNFVLPLTQRYLFSRKLEFYPHEMASKLHSYKNDKGKLSELAQARTAFINRREREIEIEVTKELKQKWEEEDKQDAEALARHREALAKHREASDAWAPFVAWMAAQVGAPPDRPQAFLYGDAPPGAAPLPPHIRSEDVKKREREEELKKTIIARKEADIFLNEMKRVETDLLDRFWYQSGNFCFNMQVVMGHYARIMGMTEEEIAYTFYALNNGLATTLSPPRYPGEPALNADQREDIWLHRKDFSLMIGATPEMEERFLACKTHFALLPPPAQFQNDSRLGLLIGFKNIEGGWSPKLELSRRVQIDVHLNTIGYVADLEKPTAHFFVPQEVSWMRRVDQMQDMMNNPTQYLQNHHTTALGQAFSQLVGSSNVSLDIAKKSLASMPRIYLVPAFQGGSLLKRMLGTPLEGTFVISSNQKEAKGNLCMRDLRRSGAQTDARAAYLGQATPVEVERGISVDNEMSIIGQSLHREDGLTSAQRLLLDETAIRNSAANRDPDHLFSPQATTAQCFHYIYQAASLFPNALSGVHVQDTLFDHLFQRGLIRKTLQNNPQFLIQFGSILKNIIAKLRQKEENVLSALFITELAERIRLLAKEMAKGPHPLLRGEIESQINNELPSYEGDVDVVSRFLERIPSAQQKNYAYFALLFYSKYLKDKVTRRDAAHHVATFLKALSIFERSWVEVGHSGVLSQLNHDIQNSLPIAVSFVHNLPAQERNRFLNELAGLKASQPGEWRQHKVKPYVYKLRVHNRTFSLDFRSGTGFGVPIMTGQRGQLPVAVTENIHFKRIFKDATPLVNSKNSKDGDITEYLWTDKLTEITYSVLHHHPRHDPNGTIQIYQECEGVLYRFVSVELEKTSMWQKLRGAVGGWTFRQNTTVQKLINEKGVWVKVDKKTREALNSKSAHIALHNVISKEPIDLHLNGNTIVGATVGVGKDQKWVCSRLATIDKDLLPFQSLHNVLLLSKDKKHVDEIRFPDRTIKRSDTDPNRWVIAGREEWQWKMDRSEEAVKRFGENYRDFVQVFVETKVDKHGRLYETGKCEYYVYSYLPFSLGKKGSPVKVLKSFTDLADAYIALKSKLGFEGLRNLMQGANPGGGAAAQPPMPSDDELRGMAQLADHYLGADSVALGLNRLEEAVGQSLMGMDQDELQDKLDATTAALGVFKDALSPAPFKYTTENMGHGIKKSKGHVAPESTNHAGFLYMAYLSYLRGDFASASRYLTLMVENGNSTLEDLKQLEHIASKVLMIEIASQVAGEGRMIPTPPSFRKRMFHLKLLLSLNQIKDQLVSQHKLASKERENLFQIFRKIESGGKLYGVFSSAVKEYRTLTKEQKALLKEHGLLLSDKERDLMNQLFPVDLSHFVKSDEFLELLSRVHAPQEIIRMLRGPQPIEPEPHRFAIPSLDEIDSMLDEMRAVVDSNPPSTIEELHKRHGKAPKWNTVLANFWSYWEWIRYDKVEIEELSFLLGRIPEDADAGRAAAVDCARRLLLLAWVHKSRGLADINFRKQHEAVENSRRSLPNMREKTSRVQATSATFATESGIWNRIKLEWQRKTLKADRAALKAPSEAEVGGKKEAGGEGTYFKLLSLKFLADLTQSFEDPSFVVNPRGAMQPPVDAPRPRARAEDPKEISGNELVWTRFQVGLIRLLKPVLEQFVEPRLTAGLSPDELTAYQEHKNGLLKLVVVATLAQYKDNFMEVLDIPDVNQAWGCLVDSLLKIDFVKTVREYLSILPEDARPPIDMDLSHFQLVLRDLKDNAFNAFKWMREGSQEIQAFAGAVSAIRMGFGVAHKAAWEIKTEELKQELKTLVAHLLGDAKRMASSPAEEAELKRQMDMFIQDLQRAIDIYLRSPKGKKVSNLPELLNGIKQSLLEFNPLKKADPPSKAFDQNDGNPIARRFNAIALKLKNMVEANAKTQPQEPKPRVEHVIPVAPSKRTPEMWEKDFFEAVPNSGTTKWNKRIQATRRFLEKGNLSPMERHKNEQILRGMEVKAKSLQKRCQNALKVSELKKLEEAIDKRVAEIKKECRLLESEVHEIASRDALQLGMLPLYADRTTSKDVIFEALLKKYERGELQGELEILMTRLLLAKTEMQQLLKADVIRAEMWTLLTKIAGGVDDDRFDTTVLQKQELSRLAKKNVNWLLKSDDLRRHLIEGSNRLRYARRREDGREGFVLKNPLYTRRYLATDARKHQVSRELAMNAVEDALIKGKKYINLIPGMGKSTEVTPKLVELSFEHGRVPVIVTTPELIQQSKEFLGDRAVILDFNIHYGLPKPEDRIPKDRELTNDEILTHLKSTVETIQGLEKEGRFILITPGSLASIRNKLVQEDQVVAEAMHLAKVDPGRGPLHVHRATKAAERCDLLEQIQSFMDREDVAIFVDEDTCLDISFEYNFAHGDPEKIDLILWDASVAFTFALEADPAFHEIIFNKRLPEYAKFDLATRQSYLKPVLRDIFRNVRFWKHAGWKEWAYLPKAEVTVTETYDTSRTPRDTYVIRDFRNLERELSIADQKGFRKVVLLCSDTREVGLYRRHFADLKEKQDEFISYVLGNDTRVPHWMRIDPGTLLNPKDHKGICHVVALKQLVNVSFPSVAPTSFEYNVERGFSSVNGCTVVPFGPDGEKPNTHYGNRGERNLQYLFQHMFYPIDEKLFIQKYKELATLGIPICPFQSSTWMDWSRRLNRASAGKEPYDAFMRPEFSRERMQLSLHLALENDGARRPRPALEDHPSEIICNSQDTVFSIRDKSASKKEDPCILSGTGDEVSLNHFDVNDLDGDHSRQVLSSADETTGETALSLFALDDEEAVGGLNLEVTPQRIFQDPLKEMERASEDLNCTALINSGFSVFGNRKDKLATHIRNYLDAKGIQRQLIFRNAEGKRKMWNSGVSGPMEYDPELVDEHALCIFGLDDLRGVDIQLPKGKNVYGNLLVHLGMDLDAFDQAVFRLRQLGFGQQIRISIDKKMEEYVRSTNGLGPRDKILYGHVFNALKKNTLIEEELRHVKAIIFNVQKDLKARLRLLRAPYSFLIPEARSHIALLKYRALIADATKDLYIISNAINWQKWYRPQEKIDRVEFLRNLFRAQLQRLQDIKEKYHEGFKEVEAEINGARLQNAIESKAFGDLFRQIGERHKKMIEAFGKSFNQTTNGLQVIGDLDHHRNARAILESILSEKLASDFDEEANNQQEAQQQVQMNMRQEQNVLQLTALSYRPESRTTEAIDYGVFKRDPRNMAMGHFRPVLEGFPEARHVADEIRGQFEGLYISERALQKFKVSGAKDYPNVYILVIKNQVAVGPGVAPREITRSCIVTPVEMEEVLHRAMREEREGDHTLVGIYGIQGNQTDLFCADHGNWEDKARFERDQGFKDLMTMNKFFLGWQTHLYSDAQKDYIKGLVQSMKVSGLLDVFKAFMMKLTPKSAAVISSVSKALEDEEKAEKEKAEQARMAALRHARSPEKAGGQHKVYYQTQFGRNPEEWRSDMSLLGVPFTGSDTRVAKSPPVPVSGTAVPATPSGPQVLPAADAFRNPAPISGAASAPPPADTDFPAMEPVD